MTTTPQSTEKKEAPPPEVGSVQGIAAVVLSYFIPGMGHICVGEKKRGILFFCTIHGLFALGMLLAGIRAIGPQEQPIWSITQYLAGWPTLVTAPIAKKVEAGLENATREYIKKYDEHYGNLHYSNGTSVSHEGDMAAETDWTLPELERAKAKERRMKFAAEYNPSHGTITYSPKMLDVGAVYCGIAGMLNLLVMFDVVLRVTGNLRHPAAEKSKATPAKEGAA